MAGTMTTFYSYVWWSWGLVGCDCDTV